MRKPNKPLAVKIDEAKDGDHLFLYRTREAAVLGFEEVKNRIGFIYYVNDLTIVFGNKRFIFKGGDDDLGKINADLHLMRD